MPEPSCELLFGRERRAREEVTPFFDMSNYSSFSVLSKFASVNPEKIIAML